MRDFRYPEINICGEKIMKNHETRIYHDILSAAFPPLIDDTFAHYIHELGKTRRGHIAAKIDDAIDIFARLELEFAERAR